MNSKAAENLIAMLMLDEDTRNAFLRDPYDTVARFTDQSECEAVTASVLNFTMLESTIHPHAPKDGKGTWGPKACGETGHLICNCGGGSGGHFAVC